MPDTMKIQYKINPSNIEIPLSSQSKLIYEEKEEALWIRLNLKPRPTHNPVFLKDANLFVSFLKENDGKLKVENKEYQIRYLILCSDMPGVFSLGGDLDLFFKNIQKQDRDYILQYAVNSVSLHHEYYHSFGLPLTTIGLIQGDCFGGGLEFALCNHYLIAEKRARFCFPEMRFNMFPGHCAVSILKRKCTPKIASDLIKSGKVYTAQQMFEWGIVDRLVEDGKGEEAVKSFIQNHKHNGNAFRSIESSQRRVDALSLDELMDVTKIWAEALFNLTPRDHLVMKNLTARQSELYGNPEKTSDE